MNERVVREIESIYRELEQGRSLAEVHARYCNRLAVESDCGDDAEEHEFLCNVVAFLKAAIVSNFMNEHGWHIDNDDEWKRWKKGV